jgi:ssDNA-binding Zn-finger/Zn-ribbon topoisomerase 1
MIDFHIMPKDAMDKPDRIREKGGPCPECGGPTVARRQRITSKLYFGCQNYAIGCRFNGCRNLPEKPATQK